MTEVLVYEVDEVIKITKELISQYNDATERYKRNDMTRMAISSYGSVVGLVRLLSEITDKPACEYFDELGGFGLV